MSSNVGRLLKSARCFVQARPISTTALRCKSRDERILQTIDYYLKHMDKPTYNFGTPRDKAFMYLVAFLTFGTFCTMGHNMYVLYKVHNN